MAGYWTIEESIGLREMRHSLESCISSAMPDMNAPDGFLRYRLVLRAGGTLWVETVFSKGTPRETVMGFSDSLRGLVVKVVPYGISAVRSVVLVH